MKPRLVRAKWMLLGALLAAAVLLLGADVVKSRAAGSFQALYAPGQGVLILDTADGQLWSQDGLPVGKIPGSLVIIADPGAGGK